MPRLMSVTLTEAAVVQRRKTVTRRLGWRFLKQGDRLTLCRKVMGRRTGEPLVRLAEVAVVSVRRERLSQITEADVVREGLRHDDGDFTEWDTETGYPTPAAWVEWFCEEMRVDPYDEVTRIEWTYLDGGAVGRVGRLGTVRPSRGQPAKAEPVAVSHVLCCAAEGQPSADVGPVSAVTSEPQPPSAVTSTTTHPTPAITGRQEG